MKYIATLFLLVAGFAWFETNQANRKLVSTDQEEQRPLCNWRSEVDEISCGAVTPTILKDLNFDLLSDDSNSYSAGAEVMSESLVGLEPQRLEQADEVATTDELESIGQFSDPDEIDMFSYSNGPESIGEAIDPDSLDTLTTSGELQSLGTSSDPDSLDILTATGEATLIGDDSDVEDLFIDLTGNKSISTGSHIEID